MPGENDVLSTISATLLSMMRTLGRIEERLGHLEVLVGPTPVVTFDFTRGEVSSTGTDTKITEDEATVDEATQSVLKRSWDAVNQRWVYEPEPE